MRRRPLGQTNDLIQRGSGQLGINTKQRQHESPYRKNDPSNHRYSGRGSTV
jgi:hypothetical protein